MALTAIVYDRVDALALDAYPGVEKVIALTPDAQAELRANWDTIGTSSELLSDFGHARALVWCRDVQNRIIAACARHQLLDPILSNLIINRIRQLASVASRVHMTLRAIPKGHVLLLKCGENWREFEDYNIAANALTAELLWRSTAELDPGFKPPPFPWLYRQCAKLILRTLKKHGTWVISTRMGLPFGLAGVLENSQPMLRQLIVTQSAGWRDYPRLAISVWKFWRSPTAKFHLPIPVCTDAATFAAATEVLEECRNPFVARAIDTDSATTAKSVSVILGTSDSALEVIREIEAVGCVSYQTSSEAEHIVARICAKLSLKRFNVNYNSHTFSTGARNRFSNHEHYRLKVYNGLSDVVFTWSPGASKVAEALKINGDEKRIEPLAAIPMIDDEVAQRKLRIRSRPQILHAGSFLSWDRSLLWCVETSDEYADSIISLAKAILPLSEIDLNVRCKRKGECGLDVIRDLAPSGPNIEYSGTEIPYQDVIQDCVLLVSFMSTVIEEALLFRTPVLLWGPTERYTHLEPRRTIPTGPDDRAAVYTVSDQAALPEMVRAIIAAHGSLPLTDTEIEPYVWSADVPGIESFAERILAS